MLGTSGSVAQEIDVGTRQCVKTATSTAATLACEKRARAEWGAEVQRLNRALRHHLSGQRAREFATAQSAREHFRLAEFVLIDLTLGQRGDGLADPLAEGAKAQLLQQRAEQLAGHLGALRNLKNGQDLR